MANKTVKVPNINCGHCTSTIEREVGELEGVISVKADKNRKIVTVEWNEPSVTWVQITNLLTEIGYPVEA
ncbi:heavy metal-binding protein [Beggiatoa sp. PS]|nr:heavy metal-binding protein [Beggiatoa sp. PS]